MDRIKNAIIEGVDELVTSKTETVLAEGVPAADIVRNAIAPGKKTVTGDDVFLTQHDIEVFQMAKVAVCAGIEALFEKAKTSWDQVEDIILTDNLGCSLDSADAVAVGMHSAESAEKTSLMKNAVVIGCMRCIVSASQRSLTERIAW